MSSVAPRDNPKSGFQMYARWTVPLVQNPEGTPLVNSRNRFDVAWRSQSVDVQLADVRQWAPARCRSLDFEAATGFSEVDECPERRPPRCLRIE